MKETLEDYYDAMNEVLDAEFQAETVGEKVGQAMRQYRKDHDISLTAMAKKLKVSAPYLHDIEKGRRKITEKLCEKIEKHYL